MLFQVVQLVGATCYTRCNSSIECHDERWEVDRLTAKLGGLEVVEAPLHWQVDAAMQLAAGYGQVDDES